MTDPDCRPCGTDNPERPVHGSGIFAKEAFKFFKEALRLLFGEVVAAVLDHDCPHVFRERPNLTFQIRTEACGTATVSTDIGSLVLAFSRLCSASSL